MNEPEAAVWMRRMADLSRNGGALPDPALIWWKARLLERQEVRARVNRPIAIAQWASLVVPVAAAATLAISNWQAIRAIFAAARWIPLE